MAKTTNKTRRKKTLAADTVCSGKTENKLKTITALKKITARLRRESKRIVFTNGCFDMLHPGHIKVLRTAKEKGHRLIVALNSDKSVKRIKGRQRPIMDQKARSQLICALEVVDYVVLFDEPTPYKLIKSLKPDVLVKGGDWQKDKIVGRNLVKQVINIRPFGGYSTTNIIKKILKIHSYGTKKNPKSH